MMSIGTMAGICNTIKKVWCIAMTATFVINTAKQGKTVYKIYKNNRNNKEETQ